MSLQVWLPLNGDLHNQGLYGDINFTTTGTISDVNGKIGKCKSFSSSNVIAPYTYTLGTSFSICLWINWTTFPASDSNDWIIHLGKTSGYANAVVGLSCYHSTLLTVMAGGKYDSSYTHGFTADTWHHIAFTWRNTGNSYLYVDGELVKTYTNLTGGTVTAADKLSLGSNVANSSTKLKGKLNDVRFYDHFLSAQEVKAISQGLILHYKLNDLDIESTTNLISGNSHANYNYITEQVATYATTIVGKTQYENKIYTYSAYINNTSDNPLAVRFSPYNANDSDYSAYMGNYIQPGKEGRSKVTVDLTNTANWNGKVVLYIQNGNAGSVPTNKTFYIKEVQLEEKDHMTKFTPSVRTAIDIYDSAGYNNHGTSSGDLTIINSSPKFNISTHFNGDTGYVIVPYNVICPSNIFTFNLWFKKDALGTKNYETLFGGPSGFEMDTRAGTSTTLTLYMASTRGGNVFSSFSLGQWYMVTMVRDGTNELYYVNGELKKTIEAKAMPTGTYRLGAWNSNTGQNYFGEMSDFRIYATALSAEDIKELYNTSKLVDSQGNKLAREVNSL